MNQERVAYLNGEIVPRDQAKVSSRDAGFLLGDAVFDTTRTFGGRIFKLDEHLDRLYNSPDLHADRSGDSRRRRWPS